MIEIIDIKWTRGRKRMKYLHLIIRCKGINVYFLIKNIGDIFRISIYFSSNQYIMLKWLFKVYKFNRKECKKAIKMNNKMKKILKKYN